LPYWGGPVLRTNETFVIFRDPDGALSPGYRDLVLRYFADVADVAADSGSTNVYSVLNQYYDTTGPISNKSSFVGSAVDTDPYPSGCPATPDFPTCVTDGQVVTERDAFLFGRGIARPANRAFFVFTPAAVNTCFSPFGFGCASNYFCAYHSGFTGGHGDAIYAVVPYAARPGCDTGEHPNGNPADPALDAASHEHREMIDDPLPVTGWFDPYDGAESSDKCAHYFGPTRNNGTGAYNQVINGHPYLLQADWSNALAAAQGLGCVGSGADHAPTAAFTATVHGAVVTLDAGASSDPDPGDTLSYLWRFDDFSVGIGQKPHHQYAAAGTYTVSLEVLDSHGAAATATEQVTVSQPTPAPTHAFQAKFTEHLDDRGSLYGGGSVTRLASALDTGQLFWDFSNFPTSISVAGFGLIYGDGDLGDLLSMTFSATLTDTASPPAGTDYALSGSFTLQGGSGLFLGATGSGTITGTCTSSFTSDIADCTDAWRGRIGTR
jgi:PKD repeat protein